MSFHLRVCAVCFAASLALSAGEAKAQQPFTFTIVRPDLTDLNYGAVALADLDGDGDMDVVGSGNTANRPPYEPYSYVALSGSDYEWVSGIHARTYTERRIGDGLRYSNVAWTDFDGDGAFDFVVSGIAHSGAGFDTRPREGKTILYRNTGGTSVAPVNIPLIGLYGGVLEAVDIDSDGDEDLFVAGFRTPGQLEAALYRNDQGGFVAVDVPFRSLALGDAAWADYDRDGDLDLVYSGVSETGAFYTILYRNEGEGRFVEVDAGLPGLAFTSMDWGDYDHDGDPDLALSGSVLSDESYLEPVIQVWRNDNGRLVRSGVTLGSVMDGSVVWGDYDSDGALDILVLGARNVTSKRLGRIYRNEDGSFVERIALPGVAGSSASWGDHDGDGDLDILITGSNVNINPMTRLYRNDGVTVNTVPAAPDDLRAQEDGRTITLLWSAGSDVQTPTAALTYNIRVGTAPGLSDVMPAYSNVATGRRLRPDRGNAGQALQWKLQSLPIGDYYWSVQAIDQSLIGSAFAEEATFRVTVGPGRSTSIDAVPEYVTAIATGYPNPFRSTVTIPFSVREATHVDITVYNVLGARVQRLTAELKAAGAHTVRWSGEDEGGRPVAPGVYLVRMQVGGEHHTQRVTLMR